MIKAHGLGADFVMLGRPALFAIGANRAQGLRRYVEILKEEVSLVLAQIGCRDLGEVGPDILVDPPVVLTDMMKSDEAPEEAMNSCR